MVPPDENLKRGLGVGNATGLGMAPFLINHPKLISNWILTRERALQRVNETQEITATKKRQFFDILKEAKMHIEEWSTTDRQQAESLCLIKEEIEDTYLFCEFRMKQAVGVVCRVVEGKSRYRNTRTYQFHLNRALSKLVDNLE